MGYSIIIDSLVDNFINGRDNFSNRDRLFILSLNDYDIPLGGAF